MLKILSIEAEHILINSGQMRDNILFITKRYTTNEGDKLPYCVITNKIDTEPYVGSVYHFFNYKLYASIYGILNAPPALIDPEHNKLIYTFNPIECQDINSLLLYLPMLAGKLCCATRMSGY